ncbi:DUF6862 domain-containing protein [Yoonia sp. 2307UL14-13]|uniref:DUF6862 domain-containing protein n=1 Tax=Yoonia sp. 2307UL14-13 TaxID=3126506 RepID=UPI0030B10698
MILARFLLAQCVLWFLTICAPAAATINLAMADLQEGIGDGVSAGTYAEGSLPHALLHGAVGCAAAEGLGGNCASGAAAGIAQSVFAGLQEGAPERLRGQTDEDYATIYAAWERDVTAQANLLGAAVGYTTSGGQAVNVSNAANIAKSGVVNNYLWHDQSDKLETARANLAACEENGDCSAAEIQFLTERIAYFEGLDAFTDRELQAACDADPTSPLCRAYVADALCAAESRGATVCGGTPLGFERWGYHSPTTVHNARLAEAGRDYNPRFAIDQANRENLQATLDLLSNYDATVEAIRQYDSIGGALDLGLG